MVTVLHKPWFFISLLVKCRNLTGFTFTNFSLWTRKALTLIPDSDLPDTWYYFHNMYAFLWEKKHVTNCLYILAPCKVFFSLYKSSIVWHAPLLITTSLINFESVTLEFIMQNIYCSRRKTFFKTTFFFSFQMYEPLFKTARNGSGKITEGWESIKTNKKKNPAQHTLYKRVFDQW